MASYTSSSRNFWCSLGLAAALVLAAAGLNTTWPDTKYFEDKRPKIFWQNKVHATKDNSFNIVLAGDSRVYRGLSPAVFEDILKGTRAYNYGFSSGGHNPTIFAEIDRLLVDDTSAPRAVVLGITPYSLTPKAQKNDEYLMYKKMGPVSMLDPVHDFLRPMTLKRIKKIIRRKPEKPFSYTYDYLDNGWVSSDIDTHDETAALKSYKTAFNDNQVDSAAIADLMRQINLWSQAGITVIAYRPPTTKAMETIENEKSGFDEQAFIRQFKDAGGIWVNARSHVRAMALKTYDGSHLTPESSEKMSHILAKSIAEARSKD